MNQDITISDNAINQIKKLLTDPAMLDESILGFRVYIQGGGCSGFNYGFMFEIETTEDDVFIEKDGINIIVDPMSMVYLSGSTLDYKTSLAGEQFVVDNPNAQSTCGCGSSFSV